MAYCRCYGTKKSFSLAHHPQTQGGVERKNRTIIAELAKRVNQFGSDWAAQIPWLEFNLNSIPHSSTKFSPYRLMFGREPRSPFVSELPPVDTFGWDKNSKVFRRKNKKNMKMAYETAREYHRVYRENMAKQYVASFPVTLITLSPPLAKFFRLRFIF